MKQKVFHTLWGTTSNVYIMSHCGVPLRPELAGVAQGHMVSRERDVSRRAFISRPDFQVRNEYELLSPVGFPGVLLFGVRANKLGNSSVELGFAAFQMVDQGNANGRH